MIRIAVIDTNADLEHKIFNNVNIQVDYNYNYNQHSKDGHGTAVCGIIAKEIPSAQITLYPLFPNSEEGVDNATLIDILKLIYQQNNCDIINLSCGVLMLDTVNELHEICRKLRRQGVWIISGLHNSKIMSYPACFDEVIGVDQTHEIKNVKEYYWVENSPVNILGYALQQRVAWLNNTYVLTRGTSFIVPYITCKVAKILEQKLDVTNELKNNANEIIWNKTISMNKPNFSIERAVIFPFNKEMHALIRFYNRLSFSIENIYDIKYFYNIGKRPEEIIGIEDVGLSEIKNIIDISWNDNFDTIIIGHIDQLLVFLGIEMFEKLIEMALYHEKNIYTYDKYIYDSAMSKREKLNSKSEIYYSSVEGGSLEGSYKDYLWVHNTPIISIMGTSSNQGKYTLQLYLDECLKERGYCTALLSTEPNGWLLNSDAVFHFGYGNTVNITEKDSVVLLNQMLHCIETEKNPDIIIAASQSGTIPFNNYASSCISIAQTAFLHGTAPDAVILCVNMDDDIDYIERTIKHIEAYVETTVLALVVYPFVNEILYGGFVKKDKVKRDEQIHLFVSKLEEIFEGCIVVGNHIDNYATVTSVIEDYFTQKEIV